MHRADAIFGANEVEFTRVVDAAGALTHRERMTLIHALEQLERKLPPIALCVYITDHGQASDFRHHAHWILNHARIHHPSFGKREQKKAVEDAAIVEVKRGERRRQEPEEETSGLKAFTSKVIDWIRPIPPPVQQEWMLMLVLDVQLEIACFTWGYMLDPYINPDTINTCIVKTRLLFRERAMVSALKQVMQRAVRHIAIGSHGVNKTLKAGNNIIAPRMVRALTIAAGVSLLTATPGVQAEQTFEDDAIAEVVELPSTPATATPAPQPTTPTTSVSRGAAASYIEIPRWNSHDYEKLMQRKIDAGYNMLIPGGQEITPAPLPKLKTGTGAFEESDTEVRGRYTEEYRPRPGRSVPDLNDPQKILTDIERNDAHYLLQRLNAHCPFRICVCIYKAGQAVPQELTAPTLVHAVTRVDEYAVLIQYGMGENASIDIGYKSIELTDEQRHKFLMEVQEKVQAAGGGIEGLLVAMECTKAQILPLADKFEPLTAGTGYKLSEVSLPDGVGEEEEEEEESDLKKIHEMLANPAMIPYAIAVCMVIIVAIGSVIGFILWRRKGKLYETRPDYRLASRFGAGVSRHVRYLEGQEAAKAKTIF